MHLLLHLLLQLARPVQIRDERRQIQWHFVVVGCRQLDLLPPAPITSAIASVIRSVAATNGSLASMHSSAVTKNGSNTSVNGSIPTKDEQPETAWIEAEAACTAKSKRFAIHFVPGSQWLAFDLAVCSIKDQISLLRTVCARNAGFCI